MTAKLLPLTVCALLVAALLPASAAEWITIPTDAGEVRQVDRASLRNLQGIRRYQIWVTWGSRQYQYIRNVLTDCGARMRFEVTSNDDWRTQPFKSVYPETNIGKEVAWVCQVPLPEEPVNAFAPYPRLPLADGSTLSPQVPAPQAPQPTPLPPATPANPAPPAPTESTGSGFFVASNRIVTNSHVAASCSSLQVRLPDNQIAMATLEASDPRFDLAILSIRPEVGLPLPIRQVAQLGEEIMVAGFPLSGLLSADIVVANGQVNSLAGLRNDSSRLQISAPVQPGNSGGPALDRTGAVVAVVVSKLNVERVAKVTGDIAQNVNFAIKPEVIRLFLDANFVKYSVAQGKRTTLSGPDLAQVARRSTVQIVCRP